MGDIIDSIRASLHNRLRSPFLGTLTLVYIFKNWEFFYSLFTLATTDPIETRIEKIQPYFEKAISLEGLLLVVGSTAAIFVSSYVMMSLSRLVVLFFSKKVNPRIEKITDDKSVVSREHFDQLSKRFSELEERFEEEHRTVVSLREERNVLQEKVLSVTSPKDPVAVAVEPKTRRGTSEPKPKSENPLFRKLFQTIIDKKWDEEFEQIISQVRSNRRTPESALVNELIKYSMIYRNGRYAVSKEVPAMVYEFTSAGNDFVQFYVLEK